jgi:hypothetical protein
MKVIGLGITLLALSLVSCCGQVPIEVEVTQSQDQFLLGEALPVVVRVTNRSGQALRLGRDKDWLTFSVDSRDGAVVKRGEVPVEGEFELESSQVAIVRVDLEPYFILALPVRYAIIATFRFGDWRVASPPKTFELIQGSTLWQRQFGIPPAPGATNSLPEVRKYALQQVNLKGQPRLYLRLLDSSGKTLRVTPIGRLVSFAQPEAQVDRASRLHLLYQSGPSAFNYAVFNCQGELVVRQIYDYTLSRPRLPAPDDEGIISVVGGTRRLTDYDLPPRPDDEDRPAEPAATPVTPKSPGPTNAVKAPTAPTR